MYNRFGHVSNESSLATEAKLDVTATEALIRATRRSPQNCIMPAIIFCPFSNDCDSRVYVLLFYRRFDQSRK